MRPVLFLILATGLIRAAVYAIGGEQLAADPDAYRAIAETFRTTGVLGVRDASGAASPTAFRPPLYPMLLAALVDGNGHLRGGPVALFHGWLGILTVVVVYRCALRVTPFAEASQRRLAAIVAAILVAVDPILLQSANLVMTETLAAALAAIGWWCWIGVVERHSPSRAVWIVTVMGLGISAALAYLCRPTFIVWTVLLVAYALSRWCTAGRDPSWAFVAASLVGTTGLLLALWVARNDRQLGSPVWATTHGGYTLLLGNNPPYYDHLRRGRWWEAWPADEFFRRWDRRSAGDPRSTEFWSAPITPAAEGSPLGQGVEGAMGEIEEDRLAYDVARATIDREPRAFALACAVRLLTLVSPMPLLVPGRSPAAVLLVTAFYGAVWGLVLTGLWRLRRELFTPRWAAALALVASLAAVHTVYWTNLRMRAPATVVIAVLAATGLVVLLSHPRTPDGIRSY